MEEYRTVRNMSSQASEAEAASPRMSHPDVLHIVHTLHEDVCSLTRDIRQVFQENRQLKEEVAMLRSQERAPQQSAPVDSKILEMRRMKQEIDELMQRFGAASTRGSVAREVAPQTQPHPAPAVRPSSTSSMLKNMLMFMMIADMV